MVVSNAYTRMETMQIGSNNAETKLILKNVTYSPHSLQTEKWG